MSTSACSYYPTCTRTEHNEYTARASRPLFAAVSDPKTQQKPTPHACQVLHGQEADIEKAVDTVDHAAFFALVQAVTLDAPRDALLPAYLRDGMRLCYTAGVSKTCLAPSFPDICGRRKDSGRPKPLPPPPPLSQGYGPERYQRSLYGPDRREGEKKHRAVRTGLDALPLLLVADKLTQLGLVLLAEQVDDGLLYCGRGRIHRRIEDMPLWVGSRREEIGELSFCSSAMWVLREEDWSASCSLHEVELFRTSSALANRSLSSPELHITFLLHSRKLGLRATGT